MFRYIMLVVSYAVQYRSGVQNSIKAPDHTGAVVASNTTNVFMVHQGAAKAAVVGPLQLRCIWDMPGGSEGGGSSGGVVPG